MALNNRGMVVLLLVLTLVCLIVLGAKAVFANEAVEPADPAEFEIPSVEFEIPSVVEGLMKAQSWWLEKVSPRDPRRARIAEVARIVAAEAEHYELDPYLLLGTLVAESSLKLDQVGAARGETGLGQLHGTAKIEATKEVRARGLDPSTLHGQIAASSWLLWDCHLQCGSTERAVRRYLSGGCRGGGVEVADRVRARMRSIERLRNAS